MSTTTVNFKQALLVWYNKCIFCLNPQKMFTLSICQKVQYMKCQLSDFATVNIQMPAKKIYQNINLKQTNHECK